MLGETQYTKFSAANKIVNKGLKIKMPNARKIQSKNNFLELIMQAKVCHILVRVMQ